MFLLSIVEGYLRRSGTPPTRFGRDAVGDPNFVRELRRGRASSDEMAARIFSFIDRTDAAAKAAKRKGPKTCTR